MALWGAPGIRESTCRWGPEVVAPGECRAQLLTVTAPLPGGRLDGTHLLSGHFMIMGTEATEGSASEEACM